MRRWLKSTLCKRIGYLLFLFLLAHCIPAGAQRVALKTNFLYWATTTPNLGVEIRLHEQWTFDLSGNYNPFRFDSSSEKNPKLTHWLLQPELRYWLCRRFEGGYFGVHGLYGKYNLGGISFLPDLKDYRYDGDLYGGGISYGYHWAFSDRWGFEANLGVGYAYLKYAKYDCGACGKKQGDYYRHYIGPTRLALSIVYFFK